MKNIKMKLVFALIVLIAIGGMLKSCGVLMFVEIECRDFENHDDLKIYAGNIGDSIAFVNSNNQTMKFNIDHKYIYHRTKYVSDTGCGCNDMWGIMLVSNSDTISMHSDAKYVYDNKANRYDRANIEIDGALASFFTEDKSIVNNFVIDTVKFDKLIKFEYNHTGNMRFKRVYIAENIGIVQMERVNGEIWINKNLTEHLNTDYKSFLYEESTCE